MIVALKKFAAMILVVSVLLIGALYFQQFLPAPKVNESTLKCPEDYATDEERRQALEEFMREFLVNSPDDATIEDLGNARMQFLEDNNCQETLDYIRNNPTE